MTPDTRILFISNHGFLKLHCMTFDYGQIYSPETLALRNLEEMRKFGLFQKR